MSYESLGKEVGALVDRKQKEYGDSFGRSFSILETLFPDGIRVEQYRDVLLIVRIIDKLFRIATRASGDEENPAKDIAGYGLLGCGLDKETK